MKDEDKTKEGLINELTRLRQRITELERSEAEHKKIKEALQKSQEHERFLTNVLECSSQPFTQGYPDGRLMTYNTAYCNLLGYTKEELRNLKSPTDLTPPEWREVEAKVAEKMRRSGQPQRFEKEYIRKDGSRVPVEVSAHPIFNSKGDLKYYYSFFTDIAKLKKAQVELKESRDHFQALFNVMVDPVVIIDGKGGILEITNAVQKLTGFKREELVGKNFLKINVLTAKSKAIAIKNLAKRLMGMKVAPYEVEAFTKDGKKIAIEVNAAKIMYRTKPGVMIVCRDITERKCAEKALESEKKHLEALFKSIPQGIATQNLEREIIEVNPAFTEMFGYTLDEIRGKDIDEVIVPREKLWEARKITQQYYKGKICVVKTVRKRKDGGLIPVEITGAPIIVDNKQVGVYGIYKDITERRKVGEALRKSEQKYRSLVESTEDSVYLVDRNCTYLFVNKKYLSRFSLPLDKVIGRTYGEFHSEAETREFTQKVKQVYENHTALWYEHRSLRDGRYFLRTLSPVEEPGGRTMAVTVISKDVTERKRAEQSLIQSERLKALGEMAGGVAHDFNNLLAIILGNAQLLEKGLNIYKSEEIRRRLKVIARTAYEGGETVRRLQHFTRREVSTKDFTRIDLNEIVRSAVSSTSPRWKDEAEAKGITIKIKEKLGKLPPLLGNPSELTEVLTNLIFNAVEAMRKGGEITIRTEAEENKAYLYFSDTGPGIPKKIKGKIFDPFFTTKGPRASGLGLSTSYGIIKRHKGEIKVESTEGKGTTFTLSVPIPSELPSKEEELKEPVKISYREILVIDDEESVRDVLGRLLKDEGHRVVLAKTSKEGLAKFKKADFDLVLTDLGMPEMSGWQLAKRIKEINPDIPVGMITGWAPAIPKEKMKEEGVDFILSKPFDLTKVVREVNAALRSKGEV
ncbi:MAG: PAS domain S-box protein [bacterium]